MSRATWGAHVATYFTATSVQGLHSVYWRFWFLLPWVTNIITVVVYWDLWEIDLNCSRCICRRSCSRGGRTIGGVSVFKRILWAVTDINGEAKRRCWWLRSSHFLHNKVVFKAGLTIEMKWNRKCSDTAVTLYRCVLGRKGIRKA